MYFHIDLDAFFASVEQQDHPELQHKPVIVGALPGHRGVVSTCSYEARRYGLHSAMPISEAFRRCPEGVFLPVRMDRYSEVSTRVMQIFGNFTPDVLQVSIDEASLDMRGTERLWGPVDEAARQIKQAVGKECGLTVSVGIAANRYIAKIASGLQKPDGLTVVQPGHESEFMDELPLKDVWGIGQKTRARINELGLYKVRDLKVYSLELLQSMFGQACGSYIHTVVRGQDPGIYSGQQETKSVGSETTFEHDIADRETIETVLLQLSQHLRQRLFVSGRNPDGIQLKLRYADFTTTSIQSVRGGKLLGMDQIYETALDLLEQRWDGRPLRLIGLSLFGLSDRAAQPELFEDRNGKARQLERTVFEVERSGLGSLTRARLITPRKSGKQKPSERDDAPSSREPS